MPRSAADNERIRASQRAAILDAGRTVFARRGLAATMDDVAEAAGISHGLAYRYFASKADLFRALAQDALTRSPAEPAAGVPDTTPGERVARVVGALVDNRRDHPETYQLLAHVLSDPAAPRDLLVLAERRGQEFRRRLRQLIIDGQASGEVVGDEPDQLVTAIAACLDGLGRMALGRPAQGGTSLPSAAIILRMIMTSAGPAGPGARGGAADRAGTSGGAGAADRAAAAGRAGAAGSSADRGTGP